MTDGEMLPNLLKQTRQKSMKYQLMVLTTSDNIIKSLVFNG
ncbi:hypothetical protein BTN50_1424 [Candidatus Enterovibrio altilux]|uniref:Uncharacterized protein n=1 Tax=Candidatus Enterovibrio altilux TaxID=1927128 RepID=A0A291BA74_9GAMM|nr:hypothetical protein BTN50_1424 [Candidatus Enterovibrio luxaltus]